MLVPKNMTPLENVPGVAWLWLLLSVCLLGLAVLWPGPLPAHPAALQLGGSIPQTCIVGLHKRPEGFAARPMGQAGLQRFLPGWGPAAL